MISQKSIFIRSITLNIIVLLLPLSIYTQEEDKTTKIQGFVEKASDCLKSEDENCSTYYQKALSYASKHGDSLIAFAHKRISESLFQFGNTRDCIQSLRQGLAEVNAEKYPNFTSYFYKRLGNVYSRVELYDSVYPNFEKAIKYAIKGEDFNRAADNQVLMASTYNREGKVKLALETLTKAKPLVEKCTHPVPKMGMAFVLGNIYLTNRQFELAAEQFSDAMKLLKGIDDYNYNLAKINWCKTMNDLNKPLPAIEKLPEAIEYLKDDWNAQYGKYNLGLAYHLAGNYEKSIVLANENVKVAQTRNDLTLLSLNYRLLTRNYIQKENGDQAILFAAKAVNSEKQKKNLDDSVIEAFKLQADAYKVKGDVSNSLKTLETYVKLSDSLNVINNKKEIFDLQTYYETEIKKDKIKLQEEEINTLNEKAKVDKLTKGLYAGGMASALALSGLLVFGFRQRMKKNRVEKEKITKELEHKQKELTSQTLHLVQKSQFIAELKENLENLKNSPEKFKIEFKRIVMLLKKQSAADKDWEVFKSYFSEVHQDFETQLKTLSNKITDKEIRLASYVKMGLNNSEIANILNVLPASIHTSKYRLKQKLNVDKDLDFDSFIKGL
ncbi:tetratricopeptide repeat protein [Flagellimonas sp.]|uniref:tetratricopeptide repeat protein n=1 Tax=Flagellimonas sp. TaxID=2058762 RepID=UPI003B50A7EC